MLKAENYVEAEKIYKQDLDYYRSNGWSLMGLYQSLLGQGKIEEAQKIKLQFDKSWEKSDIKITSSIL